MVSKNSSITRSGPWQLSLFSYWMVPKPGETKRWPVSLPDSWPTHAGCLHLRPTSPAWSGTATSALSPRRRRGQRCGSCPCGSARWQSVCAWRRIPTKETLYRQARQVGHSRSSSNWVAWQLFMLSFKPAWLSIAIVAKYRLSLKSP